MFSPSTGAVAGPGMLFLVACYCLVIAAVTAYAAHVSLSKTDAAHRADAYKVLKLIWGTVTGSAGLITVMQHLSTLSLL